MIQRASAASRKLYPLACAQLVPREGVFELGCSETKRACKMFMRSARRGRRFLERH
jgi:hypothetical protein